MVGYSSSAVAALGRLAGGNAEVAGEVAGALRADPLAVQELVMRFVEGLRHAGGGSVSGDAG